MVPGVHQNNYHVGSWFAGYFTLYSDMVNHLQTGLFSDVDHQ